MNLDELALKVMESCGKHEKLQDAYLRFAHHLVAELVEPQGMYGKGTARSDGAAPEKGDPVDVMNLAAMVAVWEMLETPNAKVSGAGTASAGLPGYTAGDNTE